MATSDLRDTRCWEFSAKRIQASSVVTRDGPEGTIQLDAPGGITEQRAPGARSWGSGPGKNDSTSAATNQPKGPVQ
ncbi:hypothetical protein KI387_005919, partial [Taxus chinensis]